MVTLVAPKHDLCPSLQKQVFMGDFAWFNRIAQAKDVDGKAVVFNLAMNTTIAHACKQKEILTIDSFSALQNAPR